ncbi:RimK family protein [Paraglaciecola arctica]|uniref:RimK family protein n=1 Tax=Paraglaciecola arctica TaxID=1128911 RepID=UPI001C07147B|nr:RimK family protein [Paraglaciecola arctica]MBU3005023.1 RimK family protein [Paraglaciecola arctica]
MRKNLIVSNDSSVIENTNAMIVNFNQYLSEFPKKGNVTTRLINLCDSTQYLSQGYYCSLLAEARQHQVLPSVSTINDLTCQSEGLVVVIPATTARSFAKNTTSDVLVYFGWHADEHINKIAQYVFEQYPAPILKLALHWQEQKLLATIRLGALEELNLEQQASLQLRLNNFTNNVWRSNKSRKRYRWDMAILVNHQEDTPPSDPKALKHFVKAANKFGINAELVSVDEIGLLNRYDALFIRETTAIRHHTYQLARQAEKEGLVVIDDATSILRCCNKVFLHDAFSYNSVPSPKTLFVSDASNSTLEKLEQEFSYPMVLKLPESSFSKGVFKVADRLALEQKLSSILADSAIILVQEYLYTEYDWRIGVLNGRAIYACRYHMARNHWQIYNHGAKRFSSGDFETMATFEVPRQVLETAVNACSFIGSSLYGVDLKQVNDKVYVIEVNDNPSIEQGVEDRYLGYELYMQIMQEFANRLEQRGR